MVMDNHLTVEEFTHRKPELPDGGRWHELHEGLPVMMEPPDDHHGNAVLNLSRALAEWFQAREEQAVGYACHEIGLTVSRDPDTVYFPAISFFDSGRQFEQSDNTIATVVPSMVVELASANDRRREMRIRTLAYMHLGVRSVWVADTMKKEVQIIGKGSHTLALAGQQKVQCSDVLPGFEISVADVFQQPEWWK